MKNSREYGGIDRFRLIAALLIVGIHTYPLSSISEELNFGIVNILARIAVPFFLMITGYFILPQYLSQKGNKCKPLINSIKKTGLLYAGATLLYLPISIYVGYYSTGNIFVTVAKNIVFDGTFYHLWYLPALIIGVLLFYALSRRFSLNMILGITIALYIFGLLGDSYYGLTAGTPFLKGIYDIGFRAFSYTRNGLFYAPIFLAMGVVIAKKKNLLTRRTSLIGFITSLILMLAEGFILRLFNYQRHDSMYIALIPCMFFLFQFTLASKRKASPALRDISMWIYILHPLFIIGVRGAAKITGLTGLLIENSMGHYLAVCLLTFACAVAITNLCKQLKAAPCKKGRAWIELNMDNLRNNVKVLRGILPENCELMPAVKANAYGHGAVDICRELNNLGIRAFCVASVVEGVELRKGHIKGDILILGYTHPEQFNLLKRYRLTQTVIDYEYAMTLNEYGKRIKVHVKIDTGMKRLGEPSENTNNIIRIFKCENLIVTGIYTHFSAQNNGFTQAQVDYFNNALTKVKEHGFTIPKTHTQSSYGVFSRSDLIYDYVRTGLAIYGAYRETNNDMQTIGLHPVLSVKARISAVKNVFAGQAVGYGSVFFAPHDMKIAVLSVGYADGIPRSLSCGIGNVLINGFAVPIIGHVCMDMMTIDITNIENVKQGDIAVIVGKDGNQEITVFDLAKQARTIPNEILSRLSNRLERCKT